MIYIANKDKIFKDEPTMFVISKGTRYNIESSKIVKPTTFDLVVLHRIEFGSIFLKLPEGSLENDFTTIQEYREEKLNDLLNNK